MTLLPQTQQKCLAASLRYGCNARIQHVTTPGMLVMKTSLAETEVSAVAKCKQRLEVALWCTVKICFAPGQEGSFEEIVKALDGPTLVRKGTVDTISDGETTLVCDEPGSNRRAGGQVQSHNHNCTARMRHPTDSPRLHVTVW